MNLRGKHSATKLTTAHTCRQQIPVYQLNASDMRRVKGKACRDPESKDLLFPRKPGLLIYILLHINLTTHPKIPNENYVII